MTSHTVAIVGCGQMARGWFDAIDARPGLTSRLRIVGLVDIDASRAEALRRDRALEGVVAGADLSAVLSATRPDIVFDVTVPAARRDVVGTSLRAGAHVLSEKPMAGSMDEAEAMVRLAADAERRHAVVQNRRFHPALRQIRDLLAGGTVGELTAVHARFFVGAHFDGFRATMDNALLLDMAVHTFDAMRFLIDRAPIDVFCRQRNPIGSWYRDGAAADAIFGFDDGVLGTYSGSWVAEGADTSWDGEWRLVGSRGTLVWDGTGPVRGGVPGPGDGLLRDAIALELPHVDTAVAGGGHGAVIADFLDAIETGRAPETEGRDNLRSLAMVFGAIESARSGRLVRLDRAETGRAAA